jgi:hypothetical protein
LYLNNNKKKREIFIEICLFAIPTKTKKRKERRRIFI